MKKYLKITFIFIMIFSMFVKSGYSSYITINGEKVGKEARTLAGALFISENEPETVEGGSALDFLEDYRNDSDYRPYFAQGLQLAKKLSLLEEQFSTFRKIEYLEMKYYSSKK